MSGVSLRYPAATRDALRDITLSVEAGGVTWLYGALGAGCSSLLLVAAGLAPRHTGGELSGRVSVLGVDPATEPGRRALAGRIGFVTADPVSQLSGVAATVWEEVAFAPANLGWPIERIGSAATDALVRLRIAHLRERDPATLSGGELQRVVIAAMLVLQPALWLLDEPASALDQGGRTRLGQLLAAEARRGAAVVVASEDADRMLAVAERLVVLDRGGVALDGPPAALLAGESIREHGAGSTAIAALARAAAAIVPSEAPPAALQPPYPLTVSDGLARWQ